MAVRTAVISDFHLARRAGGDLLRESPARGRLLAELEGVDQVVLLGDCLELRDAPLTAALEVARPLFEEMGEALGHGRVVLVPGNHDHDLTAGMAERRRSAGELAAGSNGRLGLESIEEARHDERLRAISRRMGATELVLAYPGLWIRPDVYATHGHYLDCHNTVPTLERIAIAAGERLSGRLGEGPLAPADYEAVLEPVYGLIARAGRLPVPGGGVVGPDISIKLWRQLESGRGGSDAARVLQERVVPGAVAALNAAGLGPLIPDFSGPELRRAALRAMSEVVRRLEIEAEHVVFGHTHRTGPLEGEGEGWTLSGGTRLWNTGSWVYEPMVVGGWLTESPYWPGGCLLLEDSGPPELKRLLDAGAVRPDS